jgi:aspartate carbamoyltransferase catalytic subunit
MPDRVYSISLMLRHIIETQQFDTVLLSDVFERAARLESTRDDSLHGKILASLFFEPSTRTRFSFESAMYRLGGHVMTAENANEFSSASKGETLEDTIRVMSTYADVIVLRHPEIGSAERAAAVSSVPIVNAGDGAGQHPTQALLDLYTIKRELGRLDGIHIALVGDVRFYRAARSLAYLLGKFTDIHLSLVSAPELRMSEEMKAYLDKHGVTYEETTELDDVMQAADVVYQTRVQKERLAPEVFKETYGRYIITRERADAMKDGAIIIHPLPRVGERVPEVDDSPHAV